MDNTGERPVGVDVGDKDPFLGEVLDELSSKEYLTGDALATFIESHLVENGTKEHVYQKLEEIEQLAGKLWQATPNNLRNLDWFQTLEKNPAVVVYGRHVDFFGGEKSIFVRDTDNPENKVFSAYIVAPTSYVRFDISPEGDVSIPDFPTETYPEIAKLLKAEAIVAYASLIASNPNIATHQDKFRRIVIENREIMNLLLGPERSTRDKIKDSSSKNPISSEPATTVGSIDREKQENSENEAIAKLFSIDKKLEEIASILPVERKRLLATAGAFRKTYTNLIPTNFQNAKWQGDPGHTVRMDVNTLNWQLGLQEVGVVSYPGSDMLANGAGTFILGMGDKNIPLWGLYNFKNGKITVGKPEDQSLVDISESDNPFLYNFVADNVLGAYLTTLIGQRNIRSEVAQHQIQKTQGYRIKNNKEQLAFSLFNNSFPSIYALTSETGFSEFEDGGQKYSQGLVGFTQRIDEIRDLVPDSHEAITKLFDENPFVSASFEELDGAHQISFLKDQDSGNLSFRITTDIPSSANIGGQISKNGDLLDFDLDLEKYPVLKKFFEGFIIEKYVQILQETEIVPKDTPVTEGYLIEPLRIKNEKKDVVPQGAFDDFEEMVREDLKEGEDTKRLAMRFGYEQFVLSDPQMQRFKEYTSRYKTRMWSDLPQRFKSGKWMEEGKVYPSTSYTAHLKEERNLDFSYMFIKDPDTNDIIYVKTDANKGTEPRIRLKADGTVVAEGFDREKFPHAFTLEESSAIEAYQLMLEEQGLARMPDSTAKTLGRLKRDYHDVIEKFYEISGSDDTFRSYLESLPQDGDEHPRDDGVSVGETISSQEFAVSSDIANNETVSTPQLTTNQENAIYFLSGGDGREGLSKEFGEEYARIHKKYYRALWDIIPQAQKSGRWLPERGSGIYSTGINDTKNRVEFKKPSDSNDISFTFKSTTLQGEPLQIEGLVRSNGSIFIPDIDPSKYVGTFDGLNAQVIIGYVSLLRERKILRPSKKLIDVMDVFEKEYKELMANRQVEPEQPTDETKHNENTNTEDIITALIARTKGDMGEELFGQVIPELNKIRRRFWINTPERYKTGKWMPEGATYASKEWEEGQLHPGARLMDVRNMTFSKDPDSDRILARTELGDGNLELYINKDNTIDIPGVDLAKFGDDIEILQSGVIESYFRVLNENNFVIYNDSLNRSLNQLTNVLSRLNQKKPTSPISEQGSKPTEYRTLEEAVSLGEKGEEGLEELKAYSQFMENKLGANYPDFVAKSAELSEKLWQNIPSHLKMPNWIQGEKRSYESSFSNTSVSQNIDMRGVSFYHLQNFDLNNISDALTATIVFKNGHFDGNSLFMLRPDGSIIYPSVEINNTKEEAIFKRAIYQAYYKTLVDSKRLQPIPELDKEIEEFESGFTTDTPDAYEQNLKEVNERFDSFIDRLSPEDKARIANLSDEVRTELWNIIPQEVKDNPDISDLDNVLVVPVTKPALSTFIAPYDSFALSHDSQNTRGFFFGFSKGADLLDNVVFWQNPNGEVEFGKGLFDTPGSKVAKYQGFSLFVDVMIARRRFDSSILPEQLQEKRRELDLLLEKTVTLPEVKNENISEEEKRKVLITRLKEVEASASEETLKHFVDDYMSILRRRVWTEIPPRLRRGRWMEEGKEYSFDYAQNTEFLPDIENEKISFTFFKKFDDDQILFVRKDPDRGEEPQATLTTEGRIEYKDIDRDLFPNATALDEEFVVSAYWRMLASNHLMAEPDTLKRSITSLTVRNQPLINKYEDEKAAAKLISEEGTLARQNPKLLYRQDTGEFIALKDIRTIPEKRMDYEQFVATHRQKAWSFVPPAFRTSSGITKGSILSFNLSTGMENDPFKDTQLWVRHSPYLSDNRLYFSLNNPNPTIEGFINSDGTIEIPGLDREKFRDGLNFLNLNLIQWYLGALEPRKVVDAAAFGRYWEEYKQLREESFFNCLANLADNPIAEQKTAQTTERTPRKRFKPGEAGKELELVFDLLLQELAKSNTIEL